jgi:hypothetical protein
MISQEDFDKFVESYNTDFHYLLSRAASGSYDCLITSFGVLKDLYEVINKLHETTHLDFKVVPYPLTFRASDPFLTSLGFDAEHIGKIYGFLEHVKRTQGREFEDCIAGSDPIKCAVAGFPHGTS